MSSKKFPTISLYSGAGGLDYGLEAAGFETRVAIEMDKDACKTLRANRPSWQVLEDRIEEVSSSVLLEAAGLKRGEAALLVGGPPCQPFSKSGYWSQGDTKRLDDPRAKTLDQYMRVVGDTLPQVMLLENVAGLSFSGKDEGIQLLFRNLEQINRKHGTKYTPNCKILRLVEYGIPQLRERFFMIADKDGRQFDFPLPTHRHPNQPVDNEALFDSNLKNPTTAWDAIGHLDPPPSEESLHVYGKWADLLPSIPEGENYLWHTPRKGGVPLFGWRTRYWGFLLKLAKRKPSWTIQAQPGSSIGPFHWKNRRLSTSEMLALMTFPDVTIVGGRTAIQRQLGNAVPSLMTEILGREILRQFFGLRRRKPYVLDLQAAQSTPRAERLKRVEEKFLHLIGDHADHPGTGLGPMAMARGR
ncbi:MAG: DNA cytosine methyltransferase [Planctomycetota bacterium]